MSSLKFLSAAAALALALPMILATSAFAQHAGGAVAHGGGIGGGGGGGGGFVGGGGGGGGGFVGHGGGGGFVGGPSPSFGAGRMGPVRASPSIGYAGHGGVPVTGYAGRYAGGYGGYYYGRHRHWRGGFWPGFAIGLGSYAYWGPDYYPYYYDDEYYYDSGVAPGDAVAYCMRRFRSYNPASGTYLGFDGLQHPCP